MSAFTGAPAGRRRFWITVAIFGVLNVAAWIVYDRAVRPRNDLLRVESFSPAGGTPIDQRAKFTWRFNLDVAHADTDPAPASITPPIAGKWNWHDPRTLTFTPDAALPKATRFCFTVGSDRLHSEQGFHLPKAFVSTVQTAPLALVSATQFGFDGSDRAVIEMKFSDTVLHADVIKALQVRGPDGKNVKCDIYGDASGDVVRIVTDSLPALQQAQGDLALTLRLSSGLSGTSGPLGLPGAIEQSVPISRALIATELRADHPTRGDASLRLVFNNDVNVELMRPLISVQPSVPFQVEPGYASLRLVGDFQPATRYAVTIAKSASGADPTKYPRGDTLSVFVPDCQPSVWFEHDEGYLGSHGNRTLMAHSVNVTDLRVSITRVYDNNLVAWRNANAKGSRGTDSLALDFGKPIASKKLHLSGKKNQTQDLPIAIDDLLPEELSRDGAYRIEIAADNPLKDVSTDEDAEYGDLRGPNSAEAMVTLSDLGICAKRTREGLSAWVVSLSTAKPVPGVRLRAFSDKNQSLGAATTDENGLAALNGINPATGESVAVIIADRASSDLTWLDLRSGELSFAEAETAGQPYLRSGHEAFVYTDRGVYRPGETVHLRAIVRGADESTPAPFPVRWKILRPDLRDWNSSVNKLDDSGNASWDLPLPDDLTTGKWTARIGLPGDDKSFGSVTFQVEEFVPDRLKVGLSLADSPARIRITDKPTTAQIQGDWLFGKPASGLGTHVIARLDPIAFEPAQWNGWVFGDSANTADALGDEKPLGRRDEIDAGELDKSGAATASIDLNQMLRRAPDEDGAAPPPKSKSQRAYAGPWRLSVSASVLEPGGRAVTAMQQADVDRVDRYIALQRPELPLPPAQISQIPVALVATDGSLAQKSAPIHWALYRETWNNTLVYKDGRYHYDTSRKLDRIGESSTTKIASGRGTIAVQPSISGVYVLRAWDGNDGSVTSIEFTAAAGQWDDNISREDPEKLELSILPAKQIDLMSAIQPISAIRLTSIFASKVQEPAQHESHSPTADNSFAQVMIRSPFAGRLLLTVETDSVLSTQVIDMPASHMLLPIAIPNGCRPNAYVSATVVRPIDPNANWGVHRAAGVARLSIDNSDRRLTVAIDTPNEVRPMQSLGVHLRVVDSTGKPVPGASVHVSAVDEGICQLTNFTTPDPFAFFYAPRALGVKTADLFSELMPEVARPDKTSAVGGDADADDGRHRTPVSAKRVRPVALVGGIVRTDSNGEATANFSLPQFIGQLRVMAVAHAEAKFGSADAHTLVRSPLLVQSSWPRFVAPGDSFGVTLTAFNNTPSSGAVNLTAEVMDDSPHLRFLPAKESRAQLAPLPILAGGQSTQTLNVVADQSCGVAHVRIVATMNEDRYEESVEIPIRPASPTITTGGFAIATPDAPATIPLATNMLPGTASFEIRATPRPVLELPEGLDYLERYPYGCAEQTTSTLMPLVYLNDIGQQIAPGVFAKERVDEKVQVGITRLIGMQTADGGLAMWPGQRTPWPWVSVYAAHFLVEAQNAGHAIPDDFRAHLFAYVRGLLAHSTDKDDELETQSYACYVLALSGKPDRAAMDRLGEILTKSAGDCSQARFHLAAAWVASGRRDRAANLIPLTLPQPRSARQLAGNIGSPVRDRAILLSTLLSVDPDRADLPAMAKQLADAGKNHQWRSTQDTAFAVMALGQYLRQSKPSANYDTAELLAGATALATANQGHNLSWAAPTSQPAIADTTQLRVTGATNAKAYVAWLATGVPLSAPADADSGMKIRRRFLDERGKPIDRNTVHSGDLVQVELTLESDSSLENVVLEDLLPAGLEIENPRLETTAKDTTEGAKSATPIFQADRVDMRDDRMIVVGNLAAGVGKYVYTCRAVTPGTFTSPPVRAECMYDLGTASIAGAGSFTVIGGHDAPMVSAGQ